MSDPAVAWSSMARIAVLAYTAFDELLRSERADELDRPGWLAPAYIARLGDRTTNPTWRARERAAGIAWNWLAAHYRHESRDLHEQMDPDNVLDQAANECRADDPSPTADGALRIDGPTAPTALSPRQSRARVPLQLSVPGADGPRKVVVDVLPPEDQRLRVAAPDPAEQDVSPTTPTRLSLDLELSDDPPRAGVRPPVGLIVRAHTPDGRTYHELVALKVVPEGMVPSLALSRSAAECQNVPMDRIRLASHRQAATEILCLREEPDGPGVGRDRRDPCGRQGGGHQRAQAAADPQTAVAADPGAGLRHAGPHAGRRAGRAGRADPAPADRRRRRRAGREGARRGDRRARRLPRGDPGRVHPDLAGAAQQPDRRPPPLARARRPALPGEAGPAHGPGILPGPARAPEGRQSVRRAQAGHGGADALRRGAQCWRRATRTDGST